GGVRFLTFTRDGRWLVCGSADTLGQVLTRGRVATVDAVTGKVRRERREEQVAPLAVAPGGRLAAFAAFRDPVRFFPGLVVRALDSGRILADAPGEPGFSLRGVTFAPDGRAFVADRLERGRPRGTEHSRLWETATGKPALKLERGHDSLAFSPDG